MTSMAALVLPLWFVFGEEWGSIWCTLASCTVVVYLWEPVFVQRIALVDPTLSVGGKFSSEEHPVEVDHYCAKLLWERLEFRYGEGMFDGPEEDKQYERAALLESGLADKATSRSVVETLREEKKRDLNSKAAESAISGAPGSANTSW